MNQKLIILIALFAIQLAVPGFMIFEQNQILSKGKVFNFKTRPIDPYDPFRGRYVVLSYAANQNPIAVVPGTNIEANQWVYALLGLDKDGYAVIEGLTDKKPDDDEDFLYIETSWGTQEGGFRVKLPFNRYYASEVNAPKIESAVWRRQREQVDDVFAKIRVLDGKATIEDLYVNKMPIKDFIEKQQDKL